MGIVAAVVVDLEFFLAHHPPFYSEGWKFAEKLEGMHSVRFYVKLPQRFKVRTQIGNYNSDRALVMDETDQSGDQGDRLYPVRETKSTANLGELYRSDAQKVRCGRCHFNDALGIDYRLMESASERPGGTLIG